MKYNFFIVDRPEYKNPTTNLGNLLICIIVPIVIHYTFHIDWMLCGCVFIFMTMFIFTPSRISTGGKKKWSFVELTDGGLRLYAKNGNSAQITLNDIASVTICPSAWCGNGQFYSLSSKKIFVLDLIIRKKNRIKFVIKDIDEAKTLDILVSHFKMFGISVVYENKRFTSDISPQQLENYVESAGTFL